MNSIGATARIWLLEYDLFMFIGSVLATGFVNFILSKSQTIRIFYTQDASLWNEFTGDTIETAVLFCILYLLVAPLIYVIEQFRLRRSRISKDRKHGLALRLTFGLLCCTMISILIIELGKGYIGRLRPSFARACLSPQQPPYSSNAEVQKQIYTSDYECPTTDKKTLHDARRSFPSGHAALAVSGAAYGQLVFTRVARSVSVVNDFMAIILMAVGWALCLFAAWVSASRVFDNAHHVSDIAVGAVIGLWCAAVHFWYVTGRNDEAERLEEQSSYTEIISKASSTSNGKPMRTN